jgi:energy-coupling factor transporter ATP-binding protein EcfA2
MQLEGLFDIPPSNEIVHKWEVNLDIEDKEWNIGLIVGQSGSGKTSIIEELFPDKIYTTFEWSKDESIIDGFPKTTSVKEIVTILNSVGFSSPPAWMKPYRILSNGEKFRVNIARAIAESEELCVIDEFTSVVDRTVAQIGSAAISKYVRRSNKKFIAVTCHYDVEEWLQPDWVYVPAKGETHWRLLQQRPTIELKVYRVHHSAWSIFKHHHYLNTGINKGAKCFAAFLVDKPVAFIATLPMPHPRVKNLWRGHRLVCLPDYQGVGIGLKMSELMGAVCKANGLDYRITMSHPVLKRDSGENSNWIITNIPKVGSRSIGKVLTPKKDKKPRHDAILTRRVISAKYTGPAYPNKNEAIRLWKSNKVYI